MAEPNKSKSKSSKNPPAMSMVALRVTDRWREATDEFVEGSDLDDRSDLIRLAVATYIGQPELAKQQNEAA